MSGIRFIFTLVALVLVFIGGGYLIDHWDKLVSPRPTVTSSDSGVATTEADTASTTETTAVEQQAAQVGEVETRLRKEFDPAAADAAAEAQASQTQALPATSRSIALQPELLILDTTQLSATTVSVIAGQAPAGTEITLIANGAPIGQTTANEAGAWTVVVETPMTPGVYKLKLSGVSSAGGAAVVRDVGEVAVEAPADQTDAAAGPADTQPGDTAASEAGPKDEPAASTDTTPAASPSASAEVQASSPAQAPVAEVIVPAAVVEIAGVPPDLVAPAAPAAPEPAASAGDAAADAAESATAELAGTASTVASKAQSGSGAAPDQVAENDDSLAAQAGDVADSITTMFTDWFNATREQAEEAAKTFTLASASYKPNAEGKGIVRLSGRGPAKAKVQVMVDRRALGSTEIAESGRWLLEVTELLQPGAHTARAEILAVDGTLIVGRDLSFTSTGPPEVVAAAPATTGEGGAEAQGITTAPLVVSAVSYEAMGAKKGRVTVSGSAEPGTSIAVAADGQRIGTVTATAQGSWEVASDTWLEAGAHAIRAERLGGNGDVIERVLSEFVREQAGPEVAAAESDETEPVSSATEAAGAEALSVAAKPPKRKARSAAQKRLKLAANARRSRTRAKLAGSRSSAYHIVNVVRGKTVSRVRVRVTGRKGRIMSFVVPRGPGWYRVRRGDSLWRIANRFYGDGRSFPVIAGFNAGRVPDPDRVRPRQRLRVP